MGLLLAKVTDRAPFDGYTDPDATEAKLVRGGFTDGDTWFDTGDLVRMSGRVCACGRGLPLIDEVIGRQNDVVVDARGAAVHSEFFTHLFREDGRIQSFQVLFDDEALVVNLHASGLPEAERQRLAAPYRERLAASLSFPVVRFEFDLPFVVPANGKHRFVMRRPAG